MKEYVICKACGYISEKSSVKDVCVACGAPAKAFDPYVSKVSEKREAILSQHLHPIMVHFPQALVVMIFFLGIITLITTGELHDYLIKTVIVDAVLLPLAVLVSAILGVTDGKTRFKRLTPPALQRKIILAILFFVISTLAALLVLLFPMTSLNMVILIIMNLVALVIALILGRVGSGLMNSILPGK